GVWRLSPAKSPPPGRCRRARLPAGQTHPDEQPSPALFHSNSFLALRCFRGRPRTPPPVGASWREESAGVMPGGDRGQRTSQRTNPLTNLSKNWGRNLGEGKPCRSTKRDHGQRDATGDEPVEQRDVPRERVVPSGRDFKTGRDGASGAGQTSSRAGNRLSGPRR
ncbi:MAG: hypothetical protein ACKOFW_24315, partial [Planctomycetaceae bacterium]